MDRPVGLVAQLGEDPLRLPEGVAEEERRPLLVTIRAPPPHDLVDDRRRRVPGVDRQAERRLRNEGMTGDGLEGGTRWIGLPLVVPRQHPHLAAVLHADLRGPENVPRGMERHPGAADRQGFAVKQRLDDGVRNAAAQHRRAWGRAQIARGARPRMIAVRVSDERALDRFPGVDVEVARLTEQAGRRPRDHGRIFFLSMHNAAIATAPYSAHRTGVGTNHRCPRPARYHTAYTGSTE